METKNFGVIPPPPRPKARSIPSKPAAPVPSIKVEFMQDQGQIQPISFQWLLSSGPRIDHLRPCHHLDVREIQYHRPAVEMRIWTRTILRLTPPHNGINQRGLSREAAPAPPSISSSSTTSGERPSTSGEKRKVVKKEKVSLMKRLTSKRKSKSRPASGKNGFSCDNPCFLHPSRTSSLSHPIREK